VPLIVVLSLTSMLAPLTGVSFGLGKVFVAVLGAFTCRLAVWIATDG